MEIPIVTPTEIQKIQADLEKSFTLPEHIFYNGQWITQAQYYAVLLAEAQAKRTYHEYDVILTNATAKYLAELRVK